MMMMQPYYNQFFSIYFHKFIFLSLSKRTVNINVENERSDDEHRLIARYTARLAADSHNAVSRKILKNQIISLNVMMHL